jgi:hypothetical protein
MTYMFMGNKEGWLIVLRTVACLLTFHKQATFARPRVWGDM